MGAPKYVKQITSALALFLLGAPDTARTPP